MDINQELIQSLCLQSHLRILLKRFFQLRPLKGNAPVESLQASTPNDQMSAYLPQQPFFLMTSGAMQCGVPQKSYNTSPLCSFTPNPKSIIFTFIFQSINIFSILTSLCTIPFSCRYINAENTCLNTSLNTIYYNFLNCQIFIYWAIDTHYNNSVTIQTFSSVWMVSQNFTRLGWLISQRIQIQCYRLRLRSPSQSCFLEQIFMANLLRCQFFARRTIEQEPRPIIGPMLYWPIDYHNQVLVIDCYECMRYRRIQDGRLQTFRGRYFFKLKLIFGRNFDVDRFLSSECYTFSQSSIYSKVIRFNCEHISISLLVFFYALPKPSFYCEVLPSILYEYRGFFMYGKRIGLPNYNSHNVPLKFISVFRFYVFCLFGWRQVISEGISFYLSGRLNLIEVQMKLK